MFTPGLAGEAGSTEDPCGRYVVALEDLEEDTQVVREAPIVFGPKQSSVPVCIECCSTQITIPDKTRCVDCQLPLCSKCQAGELLRHRDECQIFLDNGKIFREEKEVSNVYPCITVLRTILAGTHGLQTHIQAREDTAVWVYNEKTVVPFITSLRDTNGNQMFTQADVHNATGALDTNSFHVQDKDVSSRAVFETASLFNNNCFPNCYREVTSAGISIKTSRRVAKGEELTICYTGLLTPNHIRQAVFQQTKHFECKCQRCLDCSEGGSYPTSLRCNNCDGGTIIEEICQTCQEKHDKDRLDQIGRLADTLVSRLVKEEDCSFLNSGYAKLHRMLSKHHYLLVKFKLYLISHAESCKKCGESEIILECVAEMKELINLLHIKKQNINIEVLRDNDVNLSSWQTFLQEKADK